jgi:hypothetical protein
MFSSNQIFEITGDNKSDLREVLELALNLDGNLYDNDNRNITKVRGYMIDPQYGIAFSWSKEASGFTDYPMPVTLDLLVELVVNYLDSKEAQEIYSKDDSYTGGDGSDKKGWRVYNPNWKQKGNPLSNFYSMIAICPHWTYYAK